MTDREKNRLEFARNSIHHIPQNSIHDSAVIAFTSEIGGDGFGWARDVDGTLVKVRHSGNVVIEKNVEIREFCTVDRAVQTSTVIGEGTKIDHHCHIAHNAKIGRYNTFANGCIVEGSCQIGDFNTFGTGVIVQRKVKIGSNCKFGSGTVVTKDVPDGETWVGNPGRKLEPKYNWSPDLNTFVNRADDDLAK